MVKKLKCQGKVTEEATDIATFFQTTLPVLIFFFESGEIV